MKIFNTIALVAGLTIAGSAVASDAIEKAAPKATEVTVGATTEAHWRGLDISDGGPAIGINGVWIADETSATVFDSGKWFVDATLATTDFPDDEGGESDYLGAIKLGMTGKLLQHSDLQYTWSINYTKFEGGFDQTDFTFGLEEMVTSTIKLGGELGYTPDLFGEADEALFGNVYALKNVGDDYYVGLEVGATQTSDIDGHSYAEVSVSKEFANGWYGKIDYTFHNGGDDYLEEMIDDSLRLSVAYKF